MLGEYRVVDLTDERGNLAGSILAALGADVVLVEPPGGSGGRRVGPFAGGRRDPERSLTFWGWNRGKRSVVLDLDTGAGQAGLAGLCAGADAVIECGAVPVDLAGLRSADPALVTATISAYGTSGPKASWPATDLTVNAAAGQLAMTGDDDRAPVRVSVPQTFLHAAAEAAGGVLVALWERRASGRGQHVEVTAQRSMMQATQAYALAHPLGGADLQRRSGGLKTATLDLQSIWPCKDGYVSITYLFGASMGPFTRRLMHWIHEEGYCDLATRDKDWIDYSNMLHDGREPVSEYERLKGVVGEFCATKTKAELLEAAQSKFLLIAPILTVGEVMDSPHFEAREYFDVVDAPELSERPLRVPGQWFVSSARPRRRLDRAPRLGEHTDEVLAEAAGRRPPARAGAAAPASPSRGARPLPFAGINVLDLTWAVAGPSTGRTFADFGATVVRIENGAHLDVARTVGPFVNDEPGNDSSGLLYNVASGKRSISVDLGCDSGRAVFEDLVRWADVVVESFSPRGREALDLRYDRLSALRPGLIMVSTCLFGQTGPLSRYAGFGTMGASISGFYDMTGWPDRAPSGPFGAYTDYPSPRYTLCTVLAALEHRRATGHGQYIDFAQAEASLHFLTPALLDQQINPGPVTRRGNADLDMAPHGVYRSAGEDRWIAIACRDDRDWRALADLIGAGDRVGLGRDERLERAAELDGLVERWTVDRAAGAAEAALIAAGVPAHAVQNSTECAVDPQLRHLRHYLTVPHPEHGTVTVEACRIGLSDTPAELWRVAPFLGEDTYQVLTDLLGYEPDRVAGLFAAGALT